MSLKGILTALARAVFPFFSVVPDTALGVALAYEYRRLTAQEAVKRLFEKPFEEAKYYLAEIAAKDEGVALEVIRFFLEHERDNSHNKEVSSVPFYISHAEVFIPEIVAKHPKNTALLKASIQALLEINNQATFKSIQRIVENSGYDAAIVPYAIHALRDLDDDYAVLWIVETGKKYAEHAITCMEALDQKIWSEETNICDYCICKIACAHPEKPEIYQYAICTLLKVDGALTLMYTSELAIKSTPEAAAFALDEMQKKRRDLKDELSEDDDKKNRSFIYCMVRIVNEKPELLEDFLAAFEHDENNIDILKYTAAAAPNVREEIFAILEDRLPSYEIDELREMIKNQPLPPADHFNFDFDLD